MQKYDTLETADFLDGAVNCHLRTCAPGELQAAPPAGLEVLDWMMERLKQRSYSGSISIEYLPGAEFDVWDAIAELKKHYHG